jgi:hypothetical protein
MPHGQGRDGIRGLRAGEQKALQVVGAERQQPGPLRFGFDPFRESLDGHALRLVNECWA